ncbi:MAG: DUF2267 domain-containing protein [Myxococcaceae bacterium]|nr:DUF2267 domain-containing protein [Myxococcaceae bacterium]
MAEKHDPMQAPNTNARQGSTRRDVPLEVRRAQRHEARTSQTYAAFIKHLCERGGMSPSVAERTAVSVLCALEQRIFGEEARDLEAQLPQKLTELLHRCERHESGPPPRKFGRAEMLRMVGEELGLKPEAVEPVIRAVFDAIRDQVSEGEVVEVMNQLPADLRDLWRPVV